MFAKHVKIDWHLLSKTYFIYFTFLSLNMKCYIFVSSGTNLLNSWRKNKGPTAYSTANFFETKKQETIIWVIPFTDLLSGKSFDISTANFCTFIKTCHSKVGQQSIVKIFQVVYEEEYKIPLPKIEKILLWWKSPHKKVT